MEELFKQYGGPILIVVAIVALIAVITAVIANSSGAFQDMTDNLRTHMNDTGTSAVVTVEGGSSTTPASTNP